jgi:hypothetical protein
MSKEGLEQLQTILVTVVMIATTTTTTTTTTHVRGTATTKTAVFY